MAAEFSVCSSRSYKLSQLSSSHVFLMGITIILMSSNEMFFLPIADADYSARNLSLSFDENTAEICVNISIEADNTFESSETFTVSLSTQDEAVVLLNSAICLTIADVDTGDSVCMQGSVIMVTRVYPWKFHGLVNLLCSFRS